MSRSVQRGPAERLAAWAVTGPPGHLWSAVADLTMLWVRYARFRARSAVSRRRNG